MPFSSLKFLLSVTGVLLVAAAEVNAEAYTLSFSKSSTRMSWHHKLPGWRYSVPVRLSTLGDSTAQLTIRGNANLSYTLDERSSGKQWLDNASARMNIAYPILGPRASIGFSASMSSRNATLQKQKISNQTFSFNFQYSPFQGTESPFRNMRVTVTPGLITANRSTRANLDSTIKETGIRYNANLNVSPNVEFRDKKINTSFGMSKSDNTLKNNKNRSESLRLSLGYTLPFDLKSSLRLSESRTQRGVTRSVISAAEELDEDSTLVQETSIVADLDEQRSTSVSTSLSGKVGDFNFNSSLSFSESLSSNTANTAEDEGNRFFLKDRKKESLSLNGSISGKLSEKLVGRTSVKYSSGDLRRLSARLASGEVVRDPSIDRKDRDLSVSGGLELQLTDGHKLNIAGQIRSIGDDNFANRRLDRDNINSSVTLGYNGKLASDMSLRINLRSSYNRKINLDARRSGDNARNRDLSLDINTSYKRLGVSISHNFGVSAKRSIFDFDRRVNINDRKSNIRRGWNMRHSLNRRFFDSLALNTSYTYKADDFGELLVENGAQIVREDNSDHSIRFGASYSPNATLSLSTSYNYRLDREWGHEYFNQRESRFMRRRNSHQNLGGDISYKPSRSTSISMRGSRSRQRSGTFDSFSVTFTRQL